MRPRTPPDPAEASGRRPRRVALVSSSYDPYTGGVEEHTRNVARELRARGHRVVVWTVDRGECLGVRRVDGIEVRYLAAPQPSGSLRGVARFLRELPGAAWAWLRAWRAARPDVLHVQCFGPNGLYALVLHHLTRTPLVVSAHGETFMDDHDVFAASRLLRTGLVHSLRAAAAVTGCSQMVLDDLRDRFGGTGGVVVPNGVDLAEPGMGPTSPDAGPRPPGAPAVVALGRVQHVKGFDLLLRAFARADLPPGTRLVIGGEGEALPPLKTLASDLGLADRVDFPGRLSRPQVAAVLARASVFVVPSRLEAFGIVVLEGWRAGIPVIATNRGGPGEFVTHGQDGLLVDPEDVAALAEALARVVRDPATGSRLGAAGADRVRDFTWTSTAARYVDVYDAALPPPPGRRARA